MRAKNAALAAISVLLAAQASANPGGPRYEEVSVADIARGFTALQLEEDRVIGRLRELGTLQAKLEERTLAESKSYVRLAKLGMLPLGGGFENFLRHAQNLERLRRNIERGLAEQQAITTERVSLRQRLLDVATELRKFARHEGALRAAESALVSARERDEAFARAFSSSRSTTVYGSTAAAIDPAELTRGFAVMRGRLPFPLSGRTEITSSTRDEGGRKGLELTATLGAAVRAVYPGKVAFAASYADYGNTVIVDHGDGYFSVSANLGRIDVGVGESVSTGTRLGAMGPGSGSRLYFELRQHGSTIDPSPWFGI